MDTPSLATVDVLVVGGGINGTGIARDAAGRGLSVLLCEQHDLAAHTSSASSKLIHGGLRYLEQFEFGLVRKALRERETLMRAAPHIIRPLQLVMPHERGQRPAWLIRSGLFLYDHLAGRDLLPASSAIDLRHHPAGQALREDYRRGFMYSDARVDDARLVVLNAVDAAERGARILTRCRFEQASREGLHWHCSLRLDDGSLMPVQANVLVNATGPWAATLLNTLRGGAGQTLRLVKGSHIIVPRLHDLDYGYLLQNNDGRIVFVLPHERDYSLIGTTDVDYTGDPAQPHIDADEIRYLCDIVNRVFSRKITSEDIVHTYSGVRALLDEPGATASKLSRDYRILADRAGPPLLSIFGGKITTYRKLAEEAVDMLTGTLGRQAPAWTATACLPGGDLCGNLPSRRSVTEFASHVAALREHYAWLPPALIDRYAHTYGTRLHALLAGRNSIDDMGEEVAPGLYQAEIQYLVQNEWARTAEDILWRRTRLGLSLGQAYTDRLDAWLQDQAFLPSGTPAMETMS